MTGMLSVRLDAGDPEAAALHAQTLGTLPLHYRIAAADENADAVLVSGRCGDWPGRVRSALDAGVRGLVLTRVSPADPAQVSGLRRRIDEAGATVVVDSPWALNPAVATAAEQIRTDFAAVTFVHGMFAVPPDARPVLGLALDHLALVRTVAAPVLQVRVLSSDDLGYELTGSAGGVPVHLSAVVSHVGAVRGELHLLSADRQWTLAFDDPSLAAAARLSRVDDRGEIGWPAVHQTGHRAAWQLLHDSLAEGVPVQYGPDALLADITALCVGIPAVR